MISSTHFQYIASKLTSLFVNKAQVVNPKMWQAIKAPQPMRELLNTSFTYSIPKNEWEMVKEINPNLPWADEHFLERVSGQPLNPGESYKTWPFYKMDDAMRPGGKFSHTYMERFWPKFADDPALPQVGIRELYGDLNDVIEQMVEDPYTRQAYLPIFFPEDTGNVTGQRIPCTLGYHFIIRDLKFHLIYYMRSCDYIRHFRDDVYLACKLAHWVMAKLNNQGVIVGGSIQPGTLTMHITSLHVFESDMYRIKKEYEKNNQR